MANLLNENNFGLIIDNAFNAVISNYDADDFAYAVDDIITEVRESIGEVAFTELVNYEALVKDIESKVENYAAVNA